MYSLELSCQLETTTKTWLEFLLGLNILFNLEKKDSFTLENHLTNEYYIAHLFRFLQFVSINFLVF